MDGRAAIGRAGQAWLSLWQTPRDAVLCGAFAMPCPCEADSDRFAELLALLDMGICAADIIAEPRYRLSQKKADRNADRGRDTIHMAPLWREPDQDETGRPALIVPVMLDDRGHEITMSMDGIGDAQSFAMHVDDLIAVPLDGTRALSLTGHTRAIGTFEPVEGVLRVYGGPLAWLGAHLTRVRALCADTPGHLVPDLHFPLPLPDRDTTLLIQPLGLDWRVRSPWCVIPATAVTIAVADSAALAKLIDARMRLPEKVRPMPLVLGPRAQTVTA